MDLSTIRTNIKNSLYEDGVHRSNAFIDTGINEGYKLMALAALFDERRTEINIDGSRNWNTLPTVSSARCIVPLYVANSHTGSRINPTTIDGMELYADAWEGQVDASGRNAQYYAIASPYHHAMNVLVTCPIQDIGKTQISFIGAFVPVSLSAGTDVPRLSEEYQDGLFYYSRFYGLIGEPGMGDKALEAYKEFIKITNALIAAIKARFPSGRDYEPLPVEFQYETITVQEQKQPEGQKSES